MNRHCEDCRHWTRHAPVDPEEPSTWGRCARVAQEDAQAAPMTTDGEVVELHTEQHFSCKQWQGR